MKKLWVLFLFVCIPATAFSAGNIHLGAAEIHPYLSLSQTYDDNIYATPSDTTYDWITTTTPGIQLKVPFRTHKIEAEYRAVIRSYWNYNSEDIADHHAAVLGDFKFASLFGLKLGDKYDKGHEPRSSSGSGEIETYDRNAANAALSYVFADRFKVETGYTRTSWDFNQDNNKFRNRSEDLIATYLYYRFLPKTSAFIEYDFKNVVFDQKTDNLDNQVQTPFLGVTWEISERTKGIVKGGYLFKKFEAGDRGSYDTWTASAELDQAFSERSSVKIVALRDVNEANTQGNSYFTTTGVFAEYTHKLGYKLSAIARGSYGEDDYSNSSGTAAERKDNTFLYGAGLKYQMRDWLEFALNFNHLDRNSNLDYRDLTDNTTSLTVNFAM